MLGFLFLQQVCQHLFDDNSIRPYENASPCGMSFNPKGDLIYSFRDGSCQGLNLKMFAFCAFHGLQLSKINLQLFFLLQMSFLNTTTITGAMDRKQGQEIPRSLHKPPLLPRLPLQKSIH